MSIENNDQAPRRMPEPLNQHPVDRNDPQRVEPILTPEAATPIPPANDDNNWDSLRSEASELWEKIKRRSEDGWNSSRDALNDAGDDTRHRWNNFVDDSRSFWNDARTETGEWRDEARERLGDWRDRARTWWDKVQDQFDGDDKAHEEQKPPPPVDPHPNEDIPPAGAW